MAKIKITADTKDAQAKVKKLKADVLELQKTIQKRTTLQVNADGSRRYTTTETYHSAGRGMKTRATTLEASAKGAKGKGEGGSGFMTTFKANAAAMALQHIPLIFATAGKLIDELIGGLTPFKTNLQSMGETIRKYMELGDAITNPAKGSLERGDSLDALDDERRANKSATLGDEVAWREAFTNQTGTNADQLLQRGQSFFDMATSGNMEEMEKAWKILTPTGLTFEDLQNNSTWENLLKLIEAYHKAGEDGMNELEPIMQEIFGRRGMVALRKAGDGSSIRANFETLRDTYREYVEPSEKAMLEATDRAELTRSRARIVDLGMPAGGERFIEQGAEDILDIAKIKFGLYGDGRDELVNELTPPEQPTQQNAQPSQPAAENVEPVAQAIEEGFNRVAPREQPFYRPAETPEYKGLFHWGEENIGGGQIKYKSFDPVGQTKKLWDNLFSANTNNPEMNQSMKDVVNELRRNTSATGQMTETMRQMGGNSPAMFA